MQMLKSPDKLPARFYVLITGCLIVSISASIFSQSSLAQSDELVPGSNLEIVGIPKIPKSLAQQVKRYTGAYGLPLAGWHPEKREIWLKGLSRASWLSRIDMPGGSPNTWMYINEPGIYDLYFHPKAKYLIYNKDANGDEAYQMYLFDLENRSSTLLSEAKTRNTEFVWSRSGDKVIYSYTPAHSRGVSLAVINPFDPKSNRILVQSTGNYLKAYGWSLDDMTAVYCEFTSNVSSKLYLVDVSSGKTELLSPRDDNGAYYVSPAFSKDSKGLYVITDRGSEFRRLAYLDLGKKKFDYLTTNIKWDVDEFQLSPDGKTIVLNVNEDGISRIYSIDTSSNQIKSNTSVPTGVISDLRWNSASSDVAFNFKSPGSPNDVYFLNIKTGQVERWAKSVSGGIDLDKFTLPDLIHWKSFDGRTISGFLYRPPASFKGKRPVIIDIHGGPEMQHRPGYSHDNNFFINELGVAKIYPNVRGSSGYGKTFLKLDNGLKREDAVKDIGALIDWIKTQPNLDADRVMVQGDSYGGYLALSAVIAYGDRLKAAVSDSGFSNLITTVEANEEWRRNIQRSEFGDERDPKIRDFMKRTAPLNNAYKLKMPLFIIQGRNDPRAPYQESESLVKAAQKSGVPVWYLSANDEGHGFVKLANYEFRVCSLILFVKEHLLK